MSDSTPHPEDLTILAAVEALERGKSAPPGAPRPAGATEATETLARLYTEVLGLIPYDLEPVEPSAGVKERLMAAVRQAGPAQTGGRDHDPPTLAEPIRLTSVPPAQPPRRGDPDDRFGSG